MNKSFPAHIRFFKRLKLASAVISLLAVSGPGITAQELSQDDMALVEMVRERTNTTNLNLDALIKASNEQVQAVAEQAAETAKVALGKATQNVLKEDQLAAVQKICHNRTRYLFISYSLGELSLKEAMAEASANPEVSLVIQGVPEGKTIQEGVLELQRLAKMFEPVPSILLNPLLFQKYDVTVVPTMIALTPGEWKGQECHQEVIARMAGITNPKVLEKHIENGDTGDLGVRGPIEEISEPNLMDVIAKRIEATDWNGLKEEARKNVWKKYPMETLPAAEKDRLLRIDPTVVATESIVTPDGKVVASKGDRVNPLDVMPFNQALVILNPARKVELEKAKELVDSLSKEKRVTVMLTEINREEGWEEYNRLARHFGRQVYLLTPDVKERFQISRTLSVVTAKDGYFYIREMALVDG